MQLLVTASIRTSPAVLTTIISPGTKEMSVSYKR